MAASVSLRMLSRVYTVARAVRARPDHAAAFPCWLLTPRLVGHFLYKKGGTEEYNMSVDVAVSELRAHLSDYLDRARDGVEVVITDRGVPVARLLGLTATTTLERLAADGVIARATAPRPRASGQPRPRPRRPVAAIVSDQRR
jgi:prevent-host-death family protein